MLLLPNTAGCQELVTKLSYRALTWDSGLKSCMIDVLLESVLVCPECGFAKRETMPTDACQFFYECINCKTLLRPKPGDCCVLCSYGSVKCPSNAERVFDQLRS